MIGTDTNLLVYAFSPHAPERSAARRALQMAKDDPRGWGIPLPSIAEFWHVITHPRTAAEPSNPQAAIDFLRALTDQGAKVWTLRATSWERLLQLAVDLNVHGRRIFDLQIALAAWENGATEVWTHDRDFKAMPGLLVRDPL